MICLFVIIPVIGGVLAYYAVPFGFVVPVVLTTWLFSKSNEALLKINARLAPQAQFDTELTRSNFVLIAVVLAFIYFHPLDNFNSSPTQWLEAQREKQYCRWINDDPTNQSEQEDKKRRLKAMDEFWEEYKTAGANLANPELNYSTTNVINKCLARVHPLLEWDLKQGKDAHGKPTFDFTIFSQDADMIPMIRTMVARAPKFANCKYYCYKQPVPPEQIEQKLKAEQRFELKGFKAKCRLRKDNLIAVDITSEQFKNSTDEEVQVAGILLCEYVLGQEARFSWLGPVTLGGGAGGIPVEAASREFKRDFESLKQIAQAKLPTKFYYELSLDESKKAMTWDNDEKALDEKVFPEPGFVPNIYLALDRYPFHSSRFSKNGEKIALFKSLSKIDDESKVDKFIDELNEDLAAKKAGQVIYGLHDEKTLKALCWINDFQKSKKLFRDLCDRYQLSHQSWILLLDSELENEEIRLYSDTKKFEAEHSGVGDKRE